MKKNSISVIIPYCNEKEYVNRAICTILEQDIESEIFIIDDKSSIPVNSIIEEKYKKYLNINIITNEKNYGQFFSIVSVASKLKNNYVHILDVDDYLGKNTYRDLLKVAENNEYDIIQFPCYFDDEKDNKTIFTGVFFNQIPIKENNLFYSFLNVYRDWVYWNKIYKLSLIKEVSEYFINNLYYYPRNATDYLLSFGIFKYAKSYFYTNQGKYFWTRREGSNTTYYHWKNPIKKIINHTLILRQLENLFNKISERTPCLNYAFSKYKNILLFDLLSLIYHRFNTLKYEIYGLIDINIDIASICYLSESLGYDPRAIFDYLSFYCLYR